MVFTETKLPGTFVIEPERMADERGFFACTFQREEFAARGLAASIVQCGLARNPRRGTVRGLHFQRAPHAEAKLVRCTHGALYDVIVDLRPDSPAFRHWVAVELTAGDCRMVYAPVGTAHGYQTLTDDTEVFYQMSAAYEPAAATGVRWDDPAFGIAWPTAPAVISARDRSFPDFSF